MTHTRLLISCLVTLSILGCGWDPSIPWSETTVRLPDNRGAFVYRQKGTHRAMVAIRRDDSDSECWLPWRPWARPVNVYYYPDVHNGSNVRLEDQFSEVLLDIQLAKTYLMVRTPDSQVFAGEILSEEAGSSSGSWNGEPWSAKVNGRPANNITSLLVATNSGQYIGRIDVTESQGSALDPVVLRFSPVEESPEYPIRRDE